MWVVALVQCAESLVTLGVAGIRFTYVWVACWVNSETHLRVKHIWAWVIRVYMTLTLERILQFC